MTSMNYRILRNDFWKNVCRMFAKKKSTHNMDVVSA
jgi:hypothetical protein